MGVARDTEGHLEGCLAAAIEQRVDVLITSGEFVSVLVYVCMRSLVAGDGGGDSPAPEHCRLFPRGLHKQH